MTTKLTFGCHGLPYSRNFCYLSCFAVRDVRDCHSPLSCLKHVICIAFCADACWLKANRSVCTHEISIGVLGDEKKSSSRLSL